MDQNLINLIFGGFMAVLGWLGKTIWDAVQDLKSDVKQIEVNLPKDYVTKDDYRSDIRDIKEMLEKLFDRLNEKADKWFFVIIADLAIRLLRSEMVTHTNSHRVCISTNGTSRSESRDNAVIIKMKWI